MEYFIAYLPINRSPTVPVVLTPLFPIKEIGFFFSTKEIWQAFCAFLDFNLWLATT
jgi:hypothetical protein